MYPLGTDKPWPINQWYIAGSSAELTDQPLGRTLLGKRVVMFRDSQGKAVALSGICPHRMMPLEAGIIAGDSLRCAYHGLTFDTSGACIAAPTPTTPIPDCSIEAYPMVEANPLLWIWLGDPAKAAATPLPDQHAAGIGNPDWYCEITNYDLAEGRYPLLVDNLFDLSHVAHLHCDTLGDVGPVLHQDIKISQNDGRLNVMREILDTPSNHFIHWLTPEIGERMSCRFESELMGISLINTIHTNWNGPTADDSSGFALNFAHGFTPQDESHTHYWLIATRNFRVHDREISDGLNGRAVAAVKEDIVAMAAIENLLQSGADLPKEISMKSDAGALRARLRVIQMIRDDDT